MSVTVIAPSVAYRFGRFELEPDERRLLASGAPVHLRPRAFDLLVALVERSGHLVTKDELLQRVWGKVIVEENTLQVNISALRKVLGANAIAAVPGRGYRFTLEVTRFETAPIAPTASPMHNLPHDLTSFIGRDKEIAELAQLLAGTRLLTLTGSGGCGKTRLAIQLARQRANAYADGAWLVELAALTDGSLLPQTVASVLGIKEKIGARLIDTIAEHISSRPLLLVLDNAEHLLDACAQLAESLLRRCERLVILVTSRERLGITGELIYRVPSLSVPDRGNRSDAGVDRGIRVCATTHRAGTIAAAGLRDQRAELCRDRIDLSQTRWHRARARAGSTAGTYPVGRRIEPSAGSALRAAHGGIEDCAASSPNAALAHGLELRPAQRR